MREYHVFFKDCLALSQMAKAETTCLSFSIERDALESATSTFGVDGVPTNVNEGDVMGLVDPYGVILYLGVVESMEENSIQCTQIESLFNDNWLYRVPNVTYLEDAIADILTGDFKQNEDVLMQQKYNFTITAETHTRGSLVSEDTVVNFETFIYSLFNSFGIRLYFDIPYGAGTPTITIAKRTYTSFKVGNNTRATTLFQPTTEVAQTNKLIVYSQDNVYRDTYYLSQDGVGTDSSEPTRLPVIRTEYVFSDDPMEDIVAQYLNENLYNHYIQFDMLVSNNLYDIFSWELGQPVEIWINAEYFDSIYTGYSLSKEERAGFDYITVKCGKVRTRLTSRLLEALG